MVISDQPHAEIFHAKATEARHTGQGGRFKFVNLLMVTSVQLFKSSLLTEATAQSTHSGGISVRQSCRARLVAAVQQMGTNAAPPHPVVQDMTDRRAHLPS
eukprot:scpid99593/ scgid20040/ 